MEELYSGHGWKLTLEQASLPDGRVKKIAVGQRSNTVHIIAKNSDGLILLLREFRPFYGHYIWMLPSGKVDKETDILIAAQRELQEETGFRAGTLRHLWVTRHAEAIRSECHIFYAEDLVSDPLPQDATELIEVHPMTLEDALEHVLSSPTVVTPSAYALLRFAREQSR